MWPCPRLSVVAVGAGIWLYDPRPRSPWLLLAAGQLCFALGDVANRSIGQSRHLRARSRRAANIFYLAAYPIMTLGFAQLVLRRRSGPGFGVMLDVGDPDRRPGPDLLGGDRRSDPRRSEHRHPGPDGSGRLPDSATWPSSPHWPAWCSIRTRAHPPCGSSRQAWPRCSWATDSRPACWARPSGR